MSRPLTRFVLGALLSVPAWGQTSTLLSAVPNDAISVAFCPDVVAFRDRMDNNGWVQFARSPVGSSFFYQALTGGGQRRVVNDLLDIGSALHGECVLFSTETMGGFLTTPPSDAQALEQAMRAWMPEGEEEAEHATLSLLGAQIDILAWPGSGHRAGHMAAFVHHPRAFGLFSADDGTSLMLGLRASLSGLNASPTNPGASRFDARVAPAVAGLRAGRRHVGRPGLVEAYADLSPAFAAFADEFSTEALPGAEFLLGEDGRVDVYVTLDLQPGAGVDLRGHLSVPPGTLAARFADCMRPLPAGLADSLPAQTVVFHSMGLDFAEAFAVGKKALAELKEDEPLNTLNQGLQVGQAMTGVDLERAVIQQLSGPTTIAFLNPDESSSDGDWPAFRSFLLRQGVANGIVFQEAFEAVVPLAEGVLQLELTDMYGADVYLLGDEEVDGGLAFLGDAFLISPGLNTLKQGLQAATGPSSGPDRGAALSALNENPGVCALSSVVLKPLLGQSSELFEVDLGALDAQSRTLLEEAQFVSTVRRVATGFELRVYTR